MHFSWFFFSNFNEDEEMTVDKDEAMLSTTAWDGEDTLLQSSAGRVSPHWIGCHDDDEMAVEEEEEGGG